MALCIRDCGGHYPSGRPSKVCDDCRPRCTGCQKILRSDNRSGHCHNCWQSQFREGNREELRRRYRKYRHANPEQLLLSSARSRAQKYDREFSITEADIHIPVLCPLLGIPLIVGSGKDGVTGASQGSPSLDRLDNSKGYVPGNVWVISWRANRAKTDFSIEEMDEMSKRWLRLRGITVIEEVTGVACPSCASDGPHERAGAAQDGSFVLARCSCGLEWRVR